VRQLTANNNVVFAEFCEQCAEFALVIALGTANGFLNPIINFQVLSFAELVDIESLVLYSLLVAAYSDVSVNHYYIMLDINKGTIGDKISVPTVGSYVLYC
jgi:hypothetical protein